MLLHRRAVAALIALFTLISVAAVSASASAATDEDAADLGQQIAVPSYFHPGGEGKELWDRLSDPGVGIVVANPFSGPGKDFDPAYAAAISAAKDAGVTVLGYVPTGYLGTTGRLTRLSETEPLSWFAQSQQDVATWYRLYGSYGLGGIFFDEVQNICGPNNSYADTYKALDDAVKGLYRGAFTVINPGIDTEECYADIGDVSLTFEGTYATYQNWTPPAWHEGRDPRRFWHLVHATDTEAKMVDAMSLGKQRNAGYMYVTPDVLANPWDSLPPASYWTAQLDAAKPATDTTAPERPGRVRVVEGDSTSLTLAWEGASDHGSGIAGYDVLLDGKRVQGTAGSTPSTVIEGLKPSTAYSITVQARDLAGNVSKSSREREGTTEAADARPPAAPSDLRASQVKVASARLAWDAPSDQDVAAYEIGMDGQPLMTLPADLLPDGPAIPVSGLTPSTGYTFTVTAEDSSGNTSPAAGPLQVTTATPSGDPISGGEGAIGADSVTYQAQYNLPFDFHHVFIDLDNDATTGFTTAGIGADYLIENSWVYKNSGGGWNWTPVEVSDPLVSSTDDLYVWQLPKSALGGTVSSHQVVFHGAGSSPEAYSPIITVG